MTIMQILHIKALGPAKLTNADYDAGGGLPRAHGSGCRTLGAPELGECYRTIRDQRDSGYAVAFGAGVIQEYIWEQTNDRLHSQLIRLQARGSNLGWGESGRTLSSARTT